LEGNQKKSLRPRISEAFLDGEYFEMFRGEHAAEFAKKNLGGGKSIF
jgi:hypothetical protein